MAKRVGTNPKNPKVGKAGRMAGAQPAPQADENSAGQAGGGEVGSKQVAISPPSGPAPASAGEEGKNVTLQLKGNDKRGRNAIFTGAAVSLRIPLAAFPDKTAPQTWEVPGLAEKRAKPTAEERKAARANAPKPTLAERVAAAEKRTEALRAKLAKANEAAASGAPA